MSSKVDVELRRALGHRAMISKPRQPLPVLELRLCLDEQLAGIDGVIERGLERAGSLLVLGLNAGRKIVERIGVGKIAAIALPRGDGQRRVHGRFPFIGPESGQERRRNSPQQRDF